MPYLNMFAGLKKKKNVIVISLCMTASFILYQLYFFLTITSETMSEHKIAPVMDFSKIEKLVHLRSKEDRFINENGIIRGVYFANMPQYRPNAKREFKCLNDDQSIPFDQVNDDYCDCADGSDEPSTNACTDSVFYCDTQYQRHTVLYNTIPSGKVNDGICDCCDGSDEWSSVDFYKKFLSQGSPKHPNRYYVPECPNMCKV